MIGKQFGSTNQMSKISRAAKSQSQCASDNSNDNDASIDPEVLDENKFLTNEELYNNEMSNVIVASWLNNLGYPEKPYEDKFLFFNSETLLNNREILEHFNPKNTKKLFADKNIEFISKKGGQDGPNQDNFFIIVQGKQGKIKIMGLFDGHGLYGHKISSLVMSFMAEYIKHSKYFSEKKLNQMSEEDIKKAIRKCFRYSQDKAKEQFKVYLKT